MRELKIEQSNINLELEELKQAYEFQQADPLKSLQSLNRMLELRRRLSVNLTKTVMSLNSRIDQAIGQFSERKIA